MLPRTVDRVPNHTPKSFNRRIEEQIEANIAEYGVTNDQQIEERLAELDREWDIERALEANAATAALIGLGLGKFVDRRFYALPAVVAGFLLQHALQGWCPPVPLFRYLGVRTQPEIEQERYALKALRGDFEPLYDGTNGSTRQPTAAAVEAVAR